MSEAKTIVLTGASSGIGLAAAQQLAAQGAALVLVSRDPVRGAAARDLVSQVATGPAPVFMAADLSRQGAIRSLASGLHKQLDRIDVLLNNAGTAARHRELTVDGLEKTFATNHLGPFLLTNLVLDLLLAAPEGRIVTTTSESHARRLEFDNLQGERRYSFFSAYARSKLANILFTYELARRLEGTRVTANCLHPGAVATRLGQNNGRLATAVTKLLRPFFRTPEQGAETAIYLASSPAVEGVNGKYFVDCREARSSRTSYDTELARRLWDASARLTGVG